MAYALSKKYLMGRKLLTLFTVFTMWFSAGIIPTYMNFNNLGLLDTRTAIIFGFAIETYNLIIMKSFLNRYRKRVEKRHSLTGQGISGILEYISSPFQAGACHSGAILWYQPLERILLGNAAFER